jgi:hypothetical protein
MATISFPSSPVNGEKYPTSPTAGVQQYQWSSSTLTWTLLGTATGVTPGIYGDTNNVGQFTVDTQGLITSAVNVAITAPTTVTFVTAPTTQTSTGTTGQIAVDSTYLYFYTGAQWQRIAWDVTPW